MHEQPTAGQKLRAWRKKRGLSQREVAERLGVSQALVTYWEADKRAPGAAIAADLAKLTKGCPKVSDWPRTRAARAVKS